MQTDETILPRWLSIAIYTAVAVFLLALLLVHTTGIWAWRVDGFVFALAGLLLLIPVADRVHKLRVGGYVEAEFNKLKSKVNHIDVDFSNLRDLTLSPDESVAAPEESEPLTPAGPLADGAGGKDVARTIRRIVWVDDVPAGNRLEIDELARRFEVLTAKTTEQGLQAIADPNATMVITDAVRVEAGTTNYEAGSELIAALGRRYPAIPVYVYCGQKTVEEHSQRFESARVRMVTSSFTELARQIRADARTSFEAEVAATLREEGEVRPQDAGLDFVLILGEERIGVEAKDYRRTPKGGPFDAAINRLVDAVEAGKIKRGVLVTPRDVFVAKQRDRTPPTVRLAAIDDLSAALERTPSRVQT